MWSCARAMGSKSGWHEVVLCKGCLRGGLTVCVWVCVCVCV